MNADFDAIIAADEEARARVEAARASSRAHVQAAINERERRRQVHRKGWLQATPV